MHLMTKEQVIKSVQTLKRLKDREEYGSWQKLTDAINIMQGETHKPISRQACFSWASKGPIPVDRVPALVELSYNEMPAYLFRPDAFPKPNI